MLEPFLIRFNLEFERKDFQNSNARFLLVYKFINYIQTMNSSGYI